MVYEILEKLSSTQEFNEELLSLLTNIHKNIESKEWDPHLAKLTLLLVSFTCQNKYIHLKKAKGPIISINKIMKKVYEFCLDMIFQILTRLVKFFSTKINIFIIFFKI